MFLFFFITYKTKETLEKVFFKLDFKAYYKLIKKYIELIIQIRQVKIIDLISLKILIL